MAIATTEIRNPLHYARNNLREALNPVQNKHAHQETLAEDVLKYLLLLKYDVDPLAPQTIDRDAMDEVVLLDTLEDGLDTVKLMLGREDLHRMYELMFKIHKEPLRLLDDVIELNYKQLRIACGQLWMILFLVESVVHFRSDSNKDRQVENDVICNNLLSSIGKELYKHHMLVPRRSRLPK